VNLGPHAPFIVSAYGAAIVIVALLVAWVAIDRRRLGRTLGELEAMGVTRRSEREVKR
jgi:heme exporter protein D